jgi:hypothetical protein
MLPCLTKFVNWQIIANDLAREGMSTGDSRLIGRVRFLRAGFVTPLPGGLGIGPAATMTGARGASL